MSTHLEFHFPALPVSVNELYIVAHGRKILSPAGRQYRNDFVARGGDLPKAQLMAFQADPGRPYQLHIILYVTPEELYNTSYGRDRRVTSPYQNWDASNGFKLAEDCIAKIVGIPDRSNLSISSHKRETAGDSAYLYALFAPISLENDPFTREKLLKAVLPSQE